MPGIYKKKNCPQCGVEHRKRGEYCSRSCASTGRKHTEEAKKKIRESNKKTYSDHSGDAYLDAVANAKDGSDKARGIVRDPIAPRQRTDIGGEVMDGDIWFSDDEF